MSQLYNRSFIFVFLSQVGFVLANTIFAHYSRWLEFLDADVEQIGQIMGGGAVVGLLMRPWIGQLVDRFGARNTWLCGYVIFASGALSNLLVDEVGPLVYACRSLSVLGASFCFSSGLAFITRMAPPDRRTEAIGSLGIAGFLGMILGPLSGDLILQKAPTATEFQQMFVAGGLAIAIPIILLSLVPADKPAGDRQPIGILQFVRVIGRHWPGTPIVLVMAAFGLCMNVPFAFLATFVVDHGLNDGVIPAVTMFFLGYSGVGISVRTFGRRIPERVGRRKILLAGIVAMAGGQLLFLTVSPQHPHRLVLAAMTTGLGHAFMFHTCSSLFLESFSDESRGAGAAFSLMVLDTGMICGAPLLGLIAGRVSYTAMFCSVAATVICCGIIYVFDSIPVWKSGRAHRPA